VLEKDFNRDLFRQFKIYGGCSHKISDESRDQKPFDGFGVINGKAYFIESKLIKDNFTSFNFNKLEDHQKRNLKSISIHAPPNVIPAVAVSYWLPRKFYGFFFFHYDIIDYLISIDKNSIKKKELLQLKEDFFINIRRTKNEKGKYTYEYDIKELETKIITTKNFIQFQN